MLYYLLRSSVDGDLLSYNVLQKEFYKIEMKAAIFRIFDMRTLNFRAWGKYDKFEPTFALNAKIKVVCDEKGRIINGQAQYSKQKRLYV